MSLGERQIICLARALARGAGILVMDESTASVDLHTERTMENVVRLIFGGGSEFGTGSGKGGFVFCFRCDRLGVGTRAGGNNGDFHRTPTTNATGLGSHPCVQRGQSGTKGRRPCEHCFFFLLLVPKQRIKFLKQRNKFWCLWVLNSDRVGLKTSLQIESGTPMALQQDPGSHFAQMLSDSEY